MNMSKEEAAVYVQMTNAIDVNPSKFIELYNAHPEIRYKVPWVSRAASDSAFDAMKFLLEQGHSPDERCDLYRPTPSIKDAARGGCLRCVQLLLDAGASINVESFDDNALFSAILAGSLDCATLLVEAGIDIHKTYTLEDGRLRNALEFAISRGCTDIADYLGSKGAVMPDEVPHQPLRQGDQILTTLQAWFQADVPKSAGTIGLGRDHGEAKLRWFDMSSMDYPFLTVFTAGLSNEPVETPAFGEAKSRVELMMHLPFTWPMEGDYTKDAAFQWPLNWIRTLPQHILSGSIPLPGTHVIISNDEPPVPLGPGTEQTCLLLIADFYQCFPIETSEGQKIHFYHVVPLYTEERDFEKANGMLPLLETMAAVGLESLVVRPDRKRFV
jgi:hypothetical protein